LAAPVGLEPTTR